MRELDRRTIEDAGIPGEVLMDRAGRGVAATVERMAGYRDVPGMRALLVAGKGNNGGDAFVAAGYLAGRGFDAEVWLTCGEKEIAGDARVHMERVKADGVALKEMAAPEDWEGVGRGNAGYDVVVDGILGTGINGAARGVAAAAIDAVNRLSARALTVAIDVPSGMDADTGRSEGSTVVADVTVTMGLPKRGFVEPCALDFVGNVETVDIGIPSEFADGYESDVDLIAASDLQPLFTRRPRSAHKGSFGRVMIVSGAAGYSGAVTMAARAAARSGAGLVTVLTPVSIAAAVASGVQEAMVHGVPETDSGSLSSALWPSWESDIKACDSLLMGPGMTSHPESRALVEHAVEAGVPLVLDADALNVQKCAEGLISGASAPVVITPHPGEMARFLERDVSAVQADRAACAVEAAELTGMTVVLKGAGTVVAGKGHVPAVNMTGNPGMASGGTGDVLAGLLAGLIAQGLEAFDAACAAVYLHGRAGDMVAWLGSQAGLVAGDVIEELPFAIGEISPR